MGEWSVGRVPAGFDEGEVVSMVLTMMLTPILCHLNWQHVLDSGRQRKKRSSIA